MNNIATRQELTPIAKLSNQLQNGADEFRKALPSHITPEKFQRTIITAVQADPALLNADRGSLLNACMKAAQDGLLPDKREAALVIFSTSKKDAQGQWSKTQLVQYMPMVYGLRKKVLQSAEVKDITAQVVYQCEIDEGLFVYERGTNNELRHRPKLTMTEEECSDDKIALAYSIATFQDGSKSDELMRRFEIDKVRQCSQTGAVGKTGYGKDKGKTIEPKGPWVDWFAEQCKKTVMRRHTKTLPMSGDVFDVEAMDDATAARSTAETLQRGEPHAPVVMPSRAELSQPREPEPAYDADTGEVADDAETDAAIEREAARLSGQGDDFGDDDESDSTAMIVKQIIDELAARKTVPDINSLMASDSIRSVMSDIGKDAVAQIEAAKSARIAEIQNGAGA